VGKPAVGVGRGCLTRLHALTVRDAPRGGDLALSTTLCREINDGVRSLESIQVSDLTGLLAHVEA
jgi:hypothetical protein